MHLTGSKGFFVLGVACACAVLVGTLSAQPAVTVVMTGLDNPRGLAFGPEGALYVAEAGRGGSGPCATNAAGELRCYGPTGAISRLWRGGQTRVVSGLPSHAVGTTGESAGGPNDIAFLGRGGAYVTMGLGNNLAFRDQVGPAGPIFGSLLHMAASGEWRIDTDVAAYEDEVNPAGGPIDSNPYGVLAVAGARLVTDAGGNSLLRVGANGQVSTVAVFPSRPVRSTDAVPTEVVVGPDGAYYVSELSGVPFAAGAARIYRVMPGEAPTVYLEGFKTAIDLDFGPDGSLYVVQNATGPVFFAAPGNVIRVAPDGTRSVLIDGLDRPTSVVVGDTGAIYVTNHGVTPGAGEVLRIEP
jgi:hypothetical protein